MIEGASSLTMSVPNIITSSPSGGRFDFDDGGTYCGGWQDGKAHGHGVCTGPKNVGEYSGSWNFGFEMSGVYKWTNGAVYEGRWQNGKRHGVGVEYNGKWHYKGEWSQGLKGRYGVKASSNSAVKYEGTWANGLQDGYGSETYSDGGYYQGQMCRGLRHGYGVRKSAPYGDSQLNNPIKNGPLTGGPTSMLIHSNSVQSTGSGADLTGTGAGLASSADDDSPKPEDGFKPNIDRTLVSKNGFVLVAKPLDVPMPQSGLKLLGDNSLTSSSSSSSRRRNSLTNKLANSARIPNQTTASLFRGLRLKKQKSASDLDMVGGARSKAGGQSGQRHAGNDSSLAGQQSGADNDLPIVPFTLSPEELDITDPTTVETYTGEWKHDKRNGHGVCDRSDGLKYEGQWHNDMKCGYGVTTFKDGTKEEGKYKNNILIVDSKVKRFFQLGGSNIRQRIDDSVKMAQQAQTMALNKAGIADTRAATARDKADQAMTAAIEADRDSQIAYSVARQYSDSQQHAGHMGLTNSASGGYQMFNQNPGMMDNQQQQQHQQAMYLPSLNMASSPLQMRRISQHQQHNNNTFYNPNQSFQQQQQQYANQSATQQQRQQNGQYLGPVEPFNGRRGSFRGGSSQQSSSGYQSGPGNQQARLQQATHYQAGGGGGSGGGYGSSSRQSADPFSDLFDHYKSSSGVGGGGGYNSSGFRSRRPMLDKQTSLDQSQMRHTSVPRQLGGSNMNSNDRMRRFRMSSLDHADENAGHQVGLPARSRASQESINRFNQQQDSMQQQYRHLVTSGEDLQQQQQQQQQQLFDLQRQQQQQQQQHQYQSALRNQQQQPDDAPSHLNAPTPTGSSYILPQSSGAGSSSAFNASNRSPSPAEPRPLSQGQQTSTGHQTNANTPYYDNSINQQQSGPGYGQGGPVNYASMIMQQQYQQRDAHSLADEQLYLADRRRARADDLLDRTEYRNYDFAITSGPRPAQRCMRRTASLSRATPIDGILGATGSGQAHRAPLLLETATPVSGSIGTLGISGGGLNRIPALATRFQQQQQQQQQQVQNRTSSPPVGGTANNWQRPEHEQRDANHLMPLANHYNADPGAGNYYQQQQQHLLSPNSCDSSSASTSPLNRKTSLQVRYDPTELGGLMSREEVAALSHAQREQKRIVAELAEQRAKRPIFHLYLTLKEFIARHQLIISVLAVNICFMKLFADLIV